MQLISLVGWSRGYRPTVAKRLDMQIKLLLSTEGWARWCVEISPPGNIPQILPLDSGGGGLGKDPRHIVSEMLGNPVNRRTLGIACWRNRPSGECLYIIYFAMLACSCAAIWRTHLHRADFDKFVGPFCSLLLGSNARYCVGSTASGNVRSSAC